MDVLTSDLKEKHKEPKIFLSSPDSRGRITVPSKVRSLLEIDSESSLEVVVRVVD